MNVFIPAAGFGERLRPITAHIPKPLLPILGRPVIDYLFDRLLQLEPSCICVNLHYKREEIEQWLNNHRCRDKVKIYVEQEILGTGGALWNAGDTLLSERLFLVHNADVFSELDLDLLINAHNPDECIATLAVTDCPSVNTLFIDDEGFLMGIADKGYHQNYFNTDRLKNKTFTGIAVYSSDFINMLPKGPSSVVDAWLKAIGSGFKIKTFDITGTYWSDIGSFDSYAKTVFDRLRKEGEEVFIASSAKGCEGISYEGLVVIENSTVFERQATIKNTIVMTDTKISSAIAVSDSIIGSDYIISHNYTKQGQGIQLGVGGSDRSFQRIKYGSASAVKMQCKIEDTDFIRHLDYTWYFKSHSVPVPYILEYSMEDRWAIFEDLGDLSLFSWMRCPRDEESIMRVYGSVIDGIVILHSIDLRLEDAPVFRDFDYQYFRWETNYFIEHYLKGHRGLWVGDNDEVYDDMHKLAERALTYPKSIIHRDLQSQNVMLRYDLSAVFIDYQGARTAPHAYDIASLCYDPYIDVSDSLRDKLCDLYVKRMGFDMQTFSESLAICRLQRLMQALGAYGFLSTMKGKRHFLKHIPRAVRLLKQAVELKKEEFPALASLIGSL